MLQQCCCPNSQEEFDAFNETSSPFTPPISALQSPLTYIVLRDRPAKKVLSFLIIACSSGTRLFDRATQNLEDGGEGLSGPSDEEEKMRENSKL